MQRRHFLSAAALAGAGATSASAAENDQNQYIELRQFYLHNSRQMQSQRLREFLEKEHLPMAKRNDLGPVGYFQVTLGADTPRLMIVSAYDSLADLEAKRRRIAGDKAWAKAIAASAGGAEPKFVRSEAWLLRAFDGMKHIAVPPKKEDGSSHHFDLRTYESETFGDSADKIRMFNEEEIAIFKKCGINPVFFGETIYGRNMPNLTYMVCYDDMAARDAAWKNFVNDPDWKRISTKPEWKNEEVVSNIHNTFLQALPFSPII